MDVRQVDPRDTEWEVEPLAYRVYFWKRDPAGQPRDLFLAGLTAFTSYEFEIRDATGVDEVVEWAERNAEGRTFTLSALLNMGGSPGLVHLFGIDPTRSPSVR